MSNEDCFELIAKERKRQNSKWGFPQCLTPGEWAGVLAEEVGELSQELNNFGTSGEHTDNLVVEAIQVAAVAVSIIQHLPKMKQVLKHMQSFRDNMVENTQDSKMTNS